MSKFTPMSCAEKYVAFLEKYHYALLAGIFLLTVYSVFLMGNIKFDNTDESFFRDDDPAVQAIERFRDLFGNEDFVYVAVNCGDVFERDNLLRLESLATALEKDVPHIREVKWLGSAEYIRGQGDEIKVGPGLEVIPENVEEIKAFKDEVLRLDDFVNVLVSEDTSIATIVLECVRYSSEDGDPRKEIAPAINKILQRPEFADLETHLAGPPIQDFESDKITRTESLKLMLLCLVIQVIMLFRMGSGARAVVVPIVVLMSSIVLTLGFISSMGWRVSMMDVMLPTILFSVCLVDTVHIISSYHLHRNVGMEYRNALVLTLREVFAPCLFTSLTTMMGFLSFLATDIIPIRMAGIYSAIGVGVAFFLSIIITPIIYLMWPEKGKVQQNKKSSHHLTEKVLRKLSILSMEHAYSVIAFFIVVSVASFYLYQGVIVETNTVKDISTSEKMRRDSDFFDTFMGGSMSLEIIVDSGSENGARKVQFLQDMEKLQRYAETLPGTVKTHSIVDIIKRVNEVLHGDEDSYFALPDQQALVSQYLFFYETSGGRNLDRELSLLSDIARIHIQTRNMGTQEVRAFMHAMDSYIDTALGSRLHVEYTGQMAWVAAIADYVAAGQTTSLGFALITVGIMMILCLRSFTLGIISMLPNLATIILPMGLMGLLDVNLSIVLMIFSSVIIGVCVDDTTHFYVNFKRIFSEKGNYRDSILETTRLVGHPITFTTVSLMFGFLVFTFSVVKTTGQFGLLGAVAFFWGWLADVSFSPALIYALKPLGKEKNKNEKWKVEISK